MKVKTKTDKHAKDNEKRCQSLKEKEKLKLNHSVIIKEALSNTGLKGNINKKIVFDDDDDDGTENVTSNVALFEDSGSDTESFEIKEKKQFAGEEGFKLLNLQSTYGGDERFKIDERFLEDKNDFNVEDENCNGNDEKLKHLSILNDVLGVSSNASVGSDKKTKKRTHEMVRYDASNREHEKYEIKPNLDNFGPPKEKKIRKKIERILEKTPKLQVSKEKFYSVSTEIKKTFNEKKEENAQFSLLQAYSQNQESESKKEDNYMQQDANNITNEEIPKEKKIINVKKNENFVFDNIKGSEKNKKNDGPKNVNTEALAVGIWKESFFFIPDDPRYKEGLDFVNKKNSDEAMEAEENYDKTRRQLKEILRLHMKKQLHRKDPFKKKVGGMNKKQLANSKSKSTKEIKQKRSSKPNPGKN